MLTILNLTHQSYILSQTNKQIKILNLQWFNESLMYTLFVEKASSIPSNYKFLNRFSSIQHYCTKTMPSWFIHLPLQWVSERMDVYPTGRWGWVWQHPSNSGVCKKTQSQRDTRDGHKLLLDHKMIDRGRWTGGACYSIPTVAGPRYRGHWDAVRYCLRATMAVNGWC